MPKYTHGTPVISYLLTQNSKQLIRHIAAARCIHGCRLAQGNLLKLKPGNRLVKKVDFRKCESGPVVGATQVDLSIS